MKQQLSDRRLKIRLNAASRQIERGLRCTGRIPVHPMKYVCRVAASKNYKSAHLGSTALIRIIKSLSDSFDPRYCQIYNHLCTELITEWRKSSQGVQTDQRLRKFGFTTKGELLSRREMLPFLRPKGLHHPNHIAKCLLLSRVTYGAEVAINSVIIRKLLETLPQAEVILVSSENMTDLFWGLSRFRVHSHSYPSNWRLKDWFDSWQDLCQLVKEEKANLDETSFLLVDPDSRLTQLGVLPLGVDGSQLYFESRTYQNSTNLPIAALTAAWARETLGGEDCLPFISLPPAAKEYARVFHTRLVPEGKNLVCINFGTGGDDQKRVGEDFEQKLLLEMFQADNFTPLIFHGVSIEEQAHVDKLLSQTQLPADGILYINGNEVKMIPTTSRPAVIVWVGPLAAYCALIGEAGLHIGYDSSGQHIAAAMGTPTVDIFAAQRKPRMVIRWSPFGQGDQRVLCYRSGAIDAMLAELRKCMEELTGDANWPK